METRNDAQEALIDSWEVKGRRPNEAGWAWHGRESAGSGCHSPGRGV